MPRTIFTGGAVFDGTGAAPAEADLVIEDGRILDVGRGLDGDHAVDCTGCTVLPGLMDCHVHLTTTTMDPAAKTRRPFSLQFFEAAHNLKRTLAAGVTTVRDAGGADLGVKVAQQQGFTPGPRVLISLAMLCQTGGHGDDWQPSGGRFPHFVRHPGVPDTVVDGPEQMRQKVRELIRNGADVIKVATSAGLLSPRADNYYGQFRDDEIITLVTEAAAAGLSTMAHAESAEGIKTAIRCGVRSVEHGYYLDDEAIDMMVERGTWLVPTLLAPAGLIASAEAGLPLPPPVVAKARAVREAHIDSVRRAAAAGVPLAMGTDSPVTPHGQNVRELVLMSDCGISPAQALHAATGSAARLLGLDSELGTLQAGKRADIVIVNGDALKLPDLTDRIDAVYQDGQQCR